MKHIFLKLNLMIILSVFGSTASFATSEISAVNFDGDKVLELVQENIGANNTCLDDYIKREKQLRRFLIWAPPLVVPAVPAAFYGGAYVTAATLSYVGAGGGWNGLVYTILGGTIAGLTTTGVFLTLEVVKGIEFAAMRRMTNLITASQARNYEHKSVKKYVKKYNKLYPADELTTHELVDRVIDLDSSGKLCDGSVRGKANPRKLKHKLAKRKHLLSYIYLNK